MNDTIVSDTPVSDNSQPTQPHIGEVYLDTRLGFAIPTSFTNYLVIPSHEQINHFMAQVHLFYRTHTDEEIALINAEQERLWYAQSEPNEIKAKPRQSKPGYIYLLKSEAGHYKIGRTHNPDDRAKTFGVKLPFRVEYICLIKCNDMELLEAALHCRFAKKRLDGEWFKLNAKDVDYMKKYAYWVQP